MCSLGHNGTVSSGHIKKGLHCRGLKDWTYRFVYKVEEFRCKGGLPATVASSSKNTVLGAVLVFGELKLKAVCEALQVAVLRIYPALLHTKRKKGSATKFSITREILMTQVKKTLIG